ncbi:MAG TPA: hypothetical protein VGD08_16800 [Stellaceae bacterium]
MIHDTPQQGRPEEYRNRARQCREHAATAKSLAIYLALSEMAREYEALAQAADGGGGGRSLPCG